jgi:Methyltransferase domain
MDRSASCDQIVRRALGLPPDMDASGLLPWAGVTEVAAALNLAPGQLLVDLGCGRGGYSLEIARQTGAAFCVGDMTANGIGTGVADAVVCIETIMFAGAHLDALRECRRILAGGGRLVLAGWEATNLADERLPRWARRIDLRRDLTEAGFEQVDVAGKPAWREAERDLYESSIAADAAGDPAIESRQEQARRGLDLFDSTRRVCATATAPG